MARWDDTEWYRSSRWSDGVAAEFERRLRQARAYNRAQYVRIQGTHLLQQDDAGTRAVGRALMRRVIDEYGPTDPDAWFAAHQLAESLRVDDSAAVAESALRDALAMAVPTGRETPPTTALSLAEMLCERGDEDALEEATVLLDSVHEGIVEMALFRDLVLRYLVVRAHVAHRRGEPEAATYARDALRVADETVPSLPRHPDLGRPFASDMLRQELGQIATGAGAVDSECSRGIPNASSMSDRWREEER